MGRPARPGGKNGAANLAAGDHAIAVDYFVDKAYIPFFKLEWEGPGVARQEIPHTALLHAANLPLPQVALTSTGGTDAFLYGTSSSPEG